MNHFLKVASIFAFGCFAAVAAVGATSPDAMQKVLKMYGLDSKVLYPREALRTSSPQKGGLYPISVEGEPGFEVNLDLDYWVLVSWSDKHDNDVISYMLNPLDEQSALNLTIGKDMHERSDAALSKDPGFSGITRGKGLVAAQKVEWRRWSDQNHLYSDCTVEVPASDGQPSYRLNVSITANSPGRRTALEGCMAGLKLVAKNLSKTQEPMVAPQAKSATSKTTKPQ